MTDKEYQKNRNRKRKFISQDNASEARVLARKFKAEYPELTQTQALLSAYVLSGRGFLSVNKIKIG